MSITPVWKEMWKNINLWETGNNGLTVGLHIWSNVRENGSFYHWIVISLKTSQQKHCPFWLLIIDFRFHHVFMLAGHTVCMAAHFNSASTGSFLSEPGQIALHLLEAHSASANNTAGYLCKLLWMWDVCLFVVGFCRHPWQRTSFMHTKLKKSWIFSDITSCGGLVNGVGCFLGAWLLDSWQRHFRNSLHVNRGAPAALIWSAHQSPSWAQLYFPHSFIVMPSKPSEIFL